MDKLPGDYIAGFVDGEGCFALKFRRDIRHDRKNKPVYFYWDVEFAILLRADDKEILEQIQQTLDCGRISISKRGSARYSVNDIDDLMNKVIPFFQKYLLRAKKRHDFNLWKEAVTIFSRNRQVRIPNQRWFSKISKIRWKDGDIDRLKKIHTEMKQFKIKSKTKDWKWLPNYTTCRKNILVRHEKSKENS